MKLIIGIDPGISGAIAFSKPGGIEVFPFAKHTPHDLVDIIKEKLHIFGTPMCYLEAVHSMPGQGVASTFKFGKNAGWWEGVLDALKIPYQRVTPLKWQVYMSCQTKGNKNVSKARAQELFPHLKVTHATADALLIAEYGRRQSTPIVSDL